LQYFDIILFALIAVFLILRLRSVLGRKTGNEKQGPTDVFGRRTHDDTSGPGQKEAAASSGDDNVYRLPDSGRSNETANPVSKPALTQIQLADKSFSQQDFLNGARMAFEMIVESFAKGDKDTLKSLLSTEVYKNFATAIDDRASRDEHEETTLVGIKTAEIHDATVEGRTAYITIKFVSEEVSIVRNKAGDVISGDPNNVIEAEDLWTFARNLESSDPNWQLVATEIPDDAS
jgi:predicted lipid-binding transport protein (Tim44 family)|tara:strand:- start:77271 stop:77969 length:699 start_codon:yes stop_codon:yes gene_type:complete